MTACHHYDDDWEQLLLGTLDDTRAAEMRAHVSGGCPTCSARWAEASRLLGALGAAVDEEEPPAHIELRLRQRLKKTPQIVAPIGVRAEPAVPPGGVEDARRTGWLPLAMAAALVAGLGGLLWMQNRALHVEVAEMRASLAAATQARDEAEPRPSVTPAPVPTVTEPQTPAATAPSATTAAADRGPVPGATVGDPEADTLALQRARDAWDRERASLAAAAERADAARMEAEDRALRLERALADARREATPATTTVSAPTAAVSTARLAELEAVVARLTAEIQRLEAESRQLTDVNREYRLAVQGALDTRATRVTLRAIDPAAGRATASATLTPDGRVLLVARDLPALPADKCYQLWIIRRDSPVITSAGVVTVGAQGQVLHAARASGAGGPITGLALTDEPAGGSVESRGRKLLFGSVN